jgi:hypothetical protein
MAMKPFENPSAPPHPFIQGLYQPRFTQEIHDKQAEASKLGARSKATGANAAGYLATTVIMATVLFFAGTAGKFDERRVRNPSLVFAILLFIFGVVRMIQLPIA